MKVLYINTVFEKGSTGRIVKDLGTMVEENGGEYRVIYGRGYSEDYHAVKLTNKVDVLFHALFSRVTDKAGFYSKRSTERMVEYIKNYNPDIIHLHNLHGYYINIEVLFKYLKNEYKGKVIWTLHDCWAFTGHCVHYSWVKCDKWKTGCFNCPQKKEYPSSLLKDNSKKNYLIKKQIFTSLEKMKIITVSDWLALQVKQSFFNKYQIKRIYNGIDHEIFKETKSDIKIKLGIENKKMILCVSDGWNDRKGYKDILQWSLKLDKEFIFVIIGLDKKQIKTLPKNIIGIERTKDLKQLAELYSAADLFFNPSKEETFGMVTAEAMSCGTPILAYDVTACSELINEKNGIKVNNFLDILKLDLENIVFNKDEIILSATKFNKENIMEETYKLYEYSLAEE